MKSLSKDQVSNYLAVHLKNWTLEGTSIKRELEFKTFAEAFSFMTAIAFAAEKSDHHPDWSNVYNKVIISLSTHSAKGITVKDFDLAGRIDAEYKRHNL